MASGSSLEMPPVPTAFGLGLVVFRLLIGFDTFTHIVIYPGAVVAVATLGVVADQDRLPKGDSIAHASSTGIA